MFSRASHCLSNQVNSVSFNPSGWWTWNAEMRKSNIINNSCSGKKTTTTKTWGTKCKNGEAGLKCKGKQLNQVSDPLSFSRLKGTICRMFYDLVECQDHYMYTAVWLGYWSTLMWNDHRGWDLSYSCRSRGVFLWLLRLDGESPCVTPDSSSSSISSPLFI